MLRANAKKIKLFICGLVGVLILSMAQQPAVYATDNYFTATGDGNRAETTGMATVLGGAVVAMILFAIRRLSKKGA